VQLHVYFFSEPCEQFNQDPVEQDFLSVTTTEQLQKLSFLVPT